MKTPQHRLRALVSGIGLAVAITTAVLVPAGYLLIVASHMGTTLSFEAHLKANRLAKYIYSNGDLWKYQVVRIAEIIEVPEAHASGYQQRVFDSGGELLLETGEAPEFPIATRSVGVVVGGQEVGRIESAGSLRPQFIEAGVVALFSSVLGFGIFFALRVLPLKVLDRTLGALEAQTMRFESALDNMSQGLCMFDTDHRLMVSNPRFAELLGLPPDAMVAGMTESQLMDLSEGAAAYHGTVSGEAEDASVLRRANGIIISVLRQGMANGGEVVTYEDITERRRAEAKISHMARHDALTNLPNRMHFNERLEQALTHTEPSLAFAVFCLDLDNFKIVNDTLGHPAGDALLRAVTARLNGATRDTDVVARLGGDEFAILQTNVAQPENATALAIRLVELMAAPFDIEGCQVVVGVSIGISLSPADGITPIALLKNADLALYRAKADGRGTYRYFEAGMDSRVQLRRSLESDLRKATELGQLQLYYQPIIDIGTEAILGFEALLRWQHPERGMVQPDDFIPLAEETGLIVPIGEWVITEACKQATKWPEDIRIAVNLSPVQFKNGNLVSDVAAALAASGLSPSRLELEITESVLLLDNDNTLRILYQLRDLGIRISMDDFGTGYSSLSYLRKFPFDKIKIDRSFINEMSDRDESLAIVRAVSAIGVSLGMLTTAEGVETREQFERVKNEGYTEVQGYLFSQPRPAGEIAELIVRLGLRQAQVRVVSAGSTGRR
ncbi:MAG: hypothetical protein JWM58_40 [Rhizobium sp.]|nr:hypothetical protein [Rhizobium sp.]